MARLTRPERATHTRDLVLAAAGKLFRSKGFHGSTLEEIADEAGFSKGVIYSQFGSKDDLMLALIEQRVGLRARRAIERIANAPKGAALRELWEQARTDRQSDIPWGLLLLEFRAHAARHPALNRRFAALHERTLAGGAEMFEALAAREGVRLAYPAADFARLVMVLDSGGVLEALADGPGSAFDLSRDALRLLLEASMSEGGNRQGGR